MDVPVTVILYNIKDKKLMFKKRHNNFCFCKKRGVWTPDRGVVKATGLRGG
jgi:hypothetical protein